MKKQLQEVMGCYGTIKDLKLFRASDPVRANGHFRTLFVIVGEFKDSWRVILRSDDTGDEYIIKKSHFIITE